MGDSGRFGARSWRRVLRASGCAVLLSASLVSVGSAWVIRQGLRVAVVTWMERTYHRRRGQARLWRLTPIEFETIMNHAVTEAA